MSNTTTECPLCGDGELDLDEAQSDGRIRRTLHVLNNYITGAIARKLEELDDGEMYG